MIDRTAVESLVNQRIDAAVLDNDELSNLAMKAGQVLYEEATGESLNHLVPIDAMLLKHCARILQACAQQLRLS